MLKGHFAVLGAVQPVSQGVGSVSTGWIDASLYNEFVALIQAGVLGTAATLDAKFEQATSAAGAGAKDVTGATITQIVKATGDNDNALLHLRTEQLDTNNNFKFFRLTLTVAAAASLVSAVVLGIGSRYVPAHAASVVEDKSF
jgi:hypothetical protein